VLHQANEATKSMSRRCSEFPREASRKTRSLVALPFLARSGKRLNYSTVGETQLPHRLPTNLSPHPPYLPSPICDRSPARVVIPHQKPWRYSHDPLPCYPSVAPAVNSLTSFSKPLNSASLSFFTAMFSSLIQPMYSTWNVATAIRKFLASDRPKVL
jgi:hypothetical protein